MVQLLTPGHRVTDKYEILEYLDSGGMGQIYRALHLPMQRVVALKVLTRPDPHAVDRFQREIMSISRVSHPNIVTIYDAGEAENGQWYMAMELLEGEQLRSRLKRGRVPLNEALEIAASICRGLQAAHEVGIVHRDLKPANVMLLDTTPGVKLLDFGVARLLSGDRPKTMTRAGVMVGTPAYMAPEQIEGERPTAQTDLYGFGCLLFELLTGHQPFGSENTLHVLRAHVFDEPPTLHDFAQEHELAPFSDALARLVRSLLEKDPRRRPASASEVLETLTRPEPVQERRPEPSRELADSEPSGPSLLPIVGGLLGLLILLSLCLLAALSWRGLLRSDDPDVRQIGGVSLGTKPLEPFELVTYIQTSYQKTRNTPQLFASYGVFWWRGQRVGPNLRIDSAVAQSSFHISPSFLPAFTISRDGEIVGVESAPYRDHLTSPARRAGTPLGQYAAFEASLSDDSLRALVSFHWRYLDTFWRGKRLRVGAPIQTNKTEHITIPLNTIYTPFPSKSITYELLSQGPCPHGPGVCVELRWHATLEPVEGQSTALTWTLSVEPETLRPHRLISNHQSRVPSPDSKTFRTTITSSQLDFVTPQQAQKNGWIEYTRN